MAIEFNSEFYIQSKFNQLEATGQLEAFGLTDVASLAAYFEENGVDAQAHYLSSGMAEGINPSPEFDTTAYLEAKLEQLQDEQYEGQYADWTVAQLAEYFESLGITALDHYNQSGINEGIEPQAPAEATEGETVDLTTGTDELTGNELDDTFNAVASALSSERTLNPDDSIDGGEGNDTLNVTLNSSFAGFNDDAGVQNVETLNLSNSGTIARNFNAANIAGVEAINLEGGVNLQNLEALGATISVADTTDNVSIGIAESAAEGSDDTLNLALSNVGSIDEDGDIEAATITADAGTEAVENLNLQVSGPSAVNLDGIAVSNLTVTGDSPLVITDVGNGLEALDASTAEGDITANIAGADAASVTLGSGNDTLTAAAADLTTNAVIDGGEGQNRLNLSSATNTQYQMSNIQTLGLTATTGTATFSARDVQGLETIELDSDYAANTAVARLGAQDLNLNVFGTADNALTLDHSGVTVIDVTPEADATATQDAATALTLTNSTAVDLAVVEDSNYTGNITANKAQSLEIAVAGQVNNQITATNATSAVFNLQNADDASAVDLQANKLVNLEVTAAGTANFNGSALNGLEALVVNTAGNFQTNAALGAINQIELSGSGAATLNGALGAADQDEYGITVNATGLNDGLTLGTIDTNGTNITVNAADVLGTVTLDAINARSGDVNVDLSNVGGTINVGTLAGANVTVDATGALGTVTYGAITASESVTLNGVELAANTATINSGSTSFTGALNGGLKADDYTVNLTNTDATSFNLSGDLGLGTDELTITLAEQTNAGEVTATYNVAGVETLNFDMGTDDNDTITLTAASSLAGVETLTVSDGTLDLTAVGGFNGDNVIVGSGIKMTAAQFANLTKLETTSANASIEITVNNDEEAQAVAAAFTELNQTGDAPKVLLNVSTSVTTEASDSLKTEAGKKSSSVTTTTIDDSGNAGETVASGVLTVKEATDATKLGDVYSIVDEAATIQGLIDDGDTDGILAGATAITTNDDPNPLALNLTVQQQSEFNVTTDYNIVDSANVIADALLASSTAFDEAVKISAMTAELTVTQAGALEAVSGKAGATFEYTLAGNADVVADALVADPAAFDNATSIVANTAELTVTQAGALEAVSGKAGATFEYTLAGNADVVADALVADPAAFDNATSIVANTAELTVTQAGALEAVSGKAGATFEYTLAGNADVVADALVTDPAAFDNATSIVANTAELTVTQAGALEAVSGKAGATFEYTLVGDVASLNGIDATSYLEATDIVLNDSADIIASALVLNAAAFDGVTEINASSAELTVTQADALEAVSGKAGATFEYTLAGNADVVADALVADPAAFDNATSIVANTAELTVTQAGALEAVSGKAGATFEYTLAGNADVVADALVADPAAFDNATSIVANTAELTVTQAGALEAVSGKAGATFEYTLAGNADVVADALVADPAAFDNATSIVANSAELTVTQAGALEAVSGKAGATFEYTLAGNADVVADALVTDPAAFDNATSIVANTAELSAVQAAALESVSGKAGVTFEYTVNDSAIDVATQLSTATFTNATLITHTETEVATAGATGTTDVPDTFIFADLPNSVVNIANFDAEAEDTITLSDADLTSVTGFMAYTGSDPSVTLSNGTVVELVVGSGAVATGAEAAFLFDTATNVLSFDADGTGMAADAVEIATLAEIVGTFDAADLSFVA